MKTILLLLDGIGDRSYQMLNNLTPLQAAVTPNLDRLAELGGNGLYHASFAGQCLPSETAHYLLFGYDLSDFPGRGLLEAVGEQVPFGDDDVLCLAHLAGVKRHQGEAVLVHGRDAIQGDRREVGELMDAVSRFETESILMRLHQTRRNDAVLVLQGPVSPFVSDSDPILRHRSIAMVQPLAGSPDQEAAIRTAKGLNLYLAYCHNVLIHHEANQKRLKEGRNVANFLVTQRCGRRVKAQPFRGKWGMRGLLISSGSVYAGIAHELGLDFLRAVDSDRPGGDLRYRVNLALKDDSHEFVHVHTKVPDEISHKGDPEQKCEAISRLDQGLGDLVKAVEDGEEVLLVIMADHSTPSSSALIHSGEPVPVSFVGKHVRRDDISRFNEVECACGSLGFLKGKELMHMVLNCTDRSSLFGHCIGPVQKPYFPLGYTPFCEKYYPESGAQNVPGMHKSGVDKEGG